MLPSIVIKLRQSADRGRLICIINTTIKLISIINQLVNFFNKKNGGRWWIIELLNYWNDWNDWNCEWKCWSSVGIEGARQRCKTGTRTAVSRSSHFTVRNRSVERHSYSRSPRGDSRQVKHGVTLIHVTSSTPIINLATLFFFFFFFFNLIHFAGAGAAIGRHWTSPAPPSFDWSGAGSDCANSALTMNPLLC